MTGLSIWTVYDHPADFPDYFVARRCVAGAKGVKLTREVLRSSDLIKLRVTLMAMGLTMLHRDPADDPVIVEVWL